MDWGEEKPNGEFLTESKHSEERLLEAARRVSGSESTLQDRHGYGEEKGETGNWRPEKAVAGCW